MNYKIQKASLQVIESEIERRIEFEQENYFLRLKSKNTEDYNQYLIQQMERFYKELDLLLIAHEHELAAAREQNFSKARNGPLYKADVSSKPTHESAQLQKIQALNDDLKQFRQVNRALLREIDTMNQKVAQQSKLIQKFQ